MQCMQVRRGMTRLTLSQLHLMCHPVLHSDSLGQTVSKYASVNIISSACDATVFNHAEHGLIECHHKALLGLAMVHA